MHLHVKWKVEQKNTTYLPVNLYSLKNFTPKAKLKTQNFIMLAALHQRAKGCNKWRGPIGAARGGEGD